MSWLSVTLGKMVIDAMNEASKKQDRMEMSLGRAEVSKVDPLDISVNQTQFTVLKVSNGKLVKVSEYKPSKSHHSDWTHEIYIIKDDEKVTDVIARVMAIKALEQ